MTLGLFSRTRIEKNKLIWRVTESECSIVFLFAKVTTIAVNMIFHRGGEKTKLGKLWHNGSA